ncbi:MAG: KPN_02809 family neutral zinc metallopeptidase [Microcoleaceae cyanobacterium]
MRWQMGRRSQNVEDRRTMGAPVAVGGGIGVVLMALVAAFLGFDPTPILNQASPSNPGAYSSRAISPEEEELADFVAVVLGDTEDTWSTLFQQLGADYQEPTLVLFSGQVESACGYATAASGPFYCPRDQKVYIDLSFYNDLKNRHQAPGDFAQAYVIAHEIGHHVQTLLGISQKVTNMQRQVSESEANQLSVMLELQADCLAGVWAHHADETRQILEQGDVEEALNAASQIGDDRLQRQAQGYIVPDSFTHGSSAQRARWFKQGLQSGDLNQCNTFEAKTL